MSDSASTARIDYLQRSGTVPNVAAGAATSAAPSSRRLLRVAGIGRPDKGSGRRDGASGPPPTVELVTGLYGYRIPLVFQVDGSPDGARVHLGTWSAREAPDAVQERRAAVLGSIVRGMYSVVDLEPVPVPARRWPQAGLALGVPSPAGVRERDGAAPLDRIIRSMSGSEWSLLVLAYPASEEAIGDIRSAILNEMRTVAAAAATERAPSPLTEQYTTLLKGALDSAADARATGAWRTAVYLLGDEESYAGLASAWRSVMSGPASLPEPVRVFDDPRVDALAAAWALPDVWGAPGPGVYRRPFECQSLLSTAQLAAIVHLPELEAPGFRVDLAPRFDTVTNDAGSDGASLRIGQVLHNRRLTDSAYTVPLRSLTRHAFVGGITGSGKTNTIMGLLEELGSRGIPFLVIEPTKAEYRALITHPRLGADVRVLTAGNATVAPLRLNPFEVPDGTPVSQHLDLVRAAFTAAFGMWTPLPQILEQCLHEIYRDRGWDLRTNTNARVTSPSERADAFPTLSDLIAKADELVPALGYEDKVSGDLRAALVTRLESLRQGGKGSMLDVTASLPAEELFGHPTIIELESLGDEGDKALLSGLLLVRLAEHRRAQGQSPDLVHLLVVEEAHRLLGNVPTATSEEVANPRGEAVETFSNLLSEIRAYGQGVVIADQVPVRLAPDAMKNTNLKIAHRMVAADDREAIAGATAMDADQARALTALPVGEAVVFSGGDDAPLLVRIPLAKDPLAAPPNDEQVRQDAERRRPGEAHLLARPFCSVTCADPEVCGTARALTGDRALQRALSRIVVSAVDDDGAVDRLWDDIVAGVRPRTPPLIEEHALLRAFAGHGADWLAARRGAQRRWSYTDTAEFRDRVRDALLERLESGAAGAATVAALRACAERLHARRFEPYPACHLVCDQQPPLCLYRSAVADLIAGGRYEDTWYRADANDVMAEERTRRETWEVCLDAAYELVEFPEEEEGQSPDSQERLDAASRRAALCFEQQMLANDTRKMPRTVRRVIDEVLNEAGVTASDGSDGTPVPQG